MFPVLNSIFQSVAAPPPPTTALRCLRLLTDMRGGGRGRPTTCPGLERTRVHGNLSQLRLLQRGSDRLAGSGRGARGHISNMIGDD